MDNYVQTTLDLKNHLRDQIDFLKASSDSFDKGFTSEAKRLALTIRILVHDTKKSKSLLTQLNMKGVKFVDTSCEVDDNNLISHAGLLLNVFPPGEPPKFIAALDSGPYGIKKIEFDEWWGSPIFIDKTRNRISRKQLILSVADKDGGAHVDASLNKMYANLSRNNSLGHMVSDGKNTFDMESPVEPAVRQVAHEILKTIDSSYKKAQIFEQAGFLIGGLRVSQGPPPIISRNKFSS